VSEPETMSAPAKQLTAPPKHRRCTRERHHVWKVDRSAGIYGSFVRCVMCGAEDLAW